MSPEILAALALLVIVGGFCILHVIRSARANDRLHAEPGATAEESPPQKGDRRYSRFFGSYVEMVHYRSDKDYNFLVLSGFHAGRTYKNQAPWSVLPLSRD